MRVAVEKTQANKTNITNSEQAGKISGKIARKINWPDLVFGPVNLWSLPPASFFYRELDSKH